MQLTGAGRSVTIDRERLIRLLRMTESDRDAEARIAIRKSNAMLRKNGMSWSDVIDLPQPAEAPFVSTDWSEVSLAGYERSDGIRRSIRREFPITLAFFPLWIAAELMAIFYPNTYWNKTASGSSWPSGRCAGLACCPGWGRGPGCCSRSALEGRPGLMR